MNEDLTDDQRDELHTALIQLRSALQATMRTTLELAQTVVLDQSSVGRLSRIDAIQQQAMATAQQQRSEIRLKQIAMALKTFEDDSFGECKKCGEPIGYRRLKARPESPCCVECMAELGG